MKVLILIFLFTSALYSNAVDFKEISVKKKVPEGTIDFTQKEVFITGSGTPGLNITNLNTARIAASRSAEKNFKVRLEVALSKMVVSKGKTVEKYLEEKKDPGFLSGLIKNDSSEEVISSKYYSDGSVDISYKVPLEKFAEQIKQKAASDFCTIAEKAIDPEEFKNGEEKKEILVVEVRNSKFEPSLFFSLESEEGEILFNSCSCVGEGAFKGTGLFIRKSPDHFLNELKSAQSYLTVLSTKIKDGSVIILKKVEVEKIRSGLNKEALKSGRIIFLIK